MAFLGIIFGSVEARKATPMPITKFRNPLTAGAALVLTLCGALAALAVVPGQGASPSIKISIDHNTNESATHAFKFQRVASPANDNAARRAKLAIIDGEADPNSGGLAALNDGILPAEEDDPDANFFFDADTPGGRFTMDFGSAIEIAAVNTYSWHPNTRGPQVYRLYASDGAAANFNPAPKAKVDPATVGWKLIATINTDPGIGETGGQYGVSITDSSGSLGKFRYLLFSCFATETDDPYGNTFYSEIVVLEKK
jgi:hypothetical protein